MRTGRQFCRQSSTTRWRQPADQALVRRGSGFGWAMGLPGERFLGVIITHQESAINSGDCQQFPVELEFDLVFHSTLTCWVSAIDLNLKFDLING